MQYTVVLGLALASLALVLILPDCDAAQQFAWRPQGRFGKRTSDEDAEVAADASSEVEGQSKRGQFAWRPQGRFGKRTIDPEEEELLSRLGLKRAQFAWRPQGRFGKRGEESGEVKREQFAWRPQGRFGKRNHEVLDGGEKKAQQFAWRPQGRFGKREADDSE